MQGKRVKKKVEEEVVPLMAGESIASTTSAGKATATRSRRNVAATIDRSDKYKNISDGLVPYKYSPGVSNKSNVDVRDAVILCQKAYYNFSTFRNIVDLMTEFSVNNIYFRGGNKKSRAFFEAFFNKINIWSLQDRFFREYYRSGNVFMHRFDAKLATEDALKVTQVYGAAESKKVNLPAKYIILNPADIQLGGSAAFHTGTYYKVLSDYELARLKNPKTEEDKQILQNLDKSARELIKKKGTSTVMLELDKDKISAVFYKKQDYEPFAVPMGFPVLEDINWKAELKKMDMAISRTMQQAILLVTMGAEPDKGGVNQKNLQAMQSLFANESVGRVLIADYTTKAEFVVPNISALLDPRKYEVVDRDIQIGLNNILVGESKFANQNAKVELFVARLSQGHEAFLNDFLIPEMKRVAKELGFKSYPTPYFDRISLKDDTNLLRIYNRLVEIGVLTAEEGIEAIETGRLPTAEDSLESQKEFKVHRDNGLFEPIMGGPETQKELADRQHQGQMELQKETIKSQEKMSREKAKEAAKNPPNLPGGAKKPGGESGRPAGTPQDQSNKSPIGDGEKSRYASFSLSRVTENMTSANKLFKAVEATLRKEHKIKRLSAKQKQVAEDIACLIIANEEEKDWDNNIKKYIKNPVDHNHKRISEIREIAAEHQIDDYLASILYASKK
jgi:hypothetical protein